MCAHIFISFIASGKDYQTPNLLEAQWHASADAPCKSDGDTNEECLAVNLRQASTSLRKSVEATAWRLYGAIIEGDEAHLEG